MTSSEMMAFITYFSFLVGDLVEPDDMGWNLYLHLFDIIHTVLKKNINRSEIEFLNFLIKEHHELYLELFDEPLKPKYHFLLHYPGCILNVGPLSYFSSIRYEAFHKIGKNNAYVVTSRRNIIFTLSLRHQLKLAFRIISSKGFQNNFKLGLERKEDKDYLVDKFAIPKAAVVPSYCDLNGIRYKKNLILHIGTDTFSDPLFGFIEFIFVLDTKLFFICSPLITMGFNQHLEGYTVEKHDNAKYLVNFDSLSNKFPAALHCVDDEKLITKMRIF